MKAATLAAALGGRKAGGGGVARCPAHDDRTPSLSIRETQGGKVLVHCHAGCDQRDVIAALRARGLWHGKMRSSVRRASSCKSAKANPEQQPPERSAAALTIWQATLPASGTLVESYLASRGLVLFLPPSLRFHPGLRHCSGGLWPAMVAMVKRGSDGVPLAVHRTYLARDGAAKAPVDPQKMMLGPCRGGAVRLAAPGEVLMVGEGIETCLAAMQATGKPGWAALSTSGLRALDLPDTVCEVIVLADGDDPGEAAAQECAWRWSREGRSVRIARPPQGMDFNDLLMRRAPRIKEGAL